MQHMRRERRGRPPGPGHPITTAGKARQGSTGVGPRIGLARAGYPHTSTTLPCAASVTGAIQSRRLTGIVLGWRTRCRYTLSKIGHEGIVLSEI